MTLIESEVVRYLRVDLGLDVDEADSRRNLVTRGVVLNELVDCEFEVGRVRLAGASLCEPCVYRWSGHATVGSSSAPSPTEAGLRA